MRLAGLALLLYAASASPQDAERGKPLYETHCGGCHYERVHDRLRPAVRDLAELRDMVARIGGDELALLLPGAGEEEAAPVLRKIVAANAVPVPFGADFIQASVSIGACVGPRGAASAEELRRHADAAMYAAKAAGGNRCGFSR